MSQEEIKIKAQGVEKFFCSSDFCGFLLIHKTRIYKQRRQHECASSHHQYKLRDMTGCAEMTSHGNVRDASIYGDAKGA